MKKAITYIVITVIMVLFVLSASATSAEHGETKIDLTQMTPIEASVGWGSLAINKGLDGNSLDIIGVDGKTVTYPKGFTAHANSNLKFDVTDMSIKALKATIGVEHATNNDAKDKSCLKFIVYADGEKIFESGEFGFTTPGQDIHVEIPSGTKVLSLASDGCGDITGDHSAWANPVLTVDESLIGVISSVKAYTEDTIICENTQTKINTVCLDGIRSEVAYDKLEYASNDESIATVDENGVITAVKEGVAVLTVKATQGEKTVSCEVSLTIVNSREAKEFVCQSPNGKTCYTLTLSKCGELSFTFGEGSFTAIEKSKIGMLTKKVDYSYDLEYESCTDTNEVNTTYSLVTGKKSTAINHYNTKTATFSKDGYYFDVEMRVYNDGFAYRIGIRNKETGSNVLEIINETSTFSFPEKTKISAEFITGISGSFSYESSYKTLDIEEIDCKTYTCFPTLAHIKNGNGVKYMLVSEADAYSYKFPGSVFRTLSDTEFGLSFAPRYKDGTTVKTTTNFKTPWRYGIYGDLSDLVESTVTDDLAPLPEGDYSWVEPGVTAWMWLSVEDGKEAQHNEKIIKQYIDLASEMKWKYVILDEGWQPSVSGKYSGYYKFFDSLVEYANEKNVGLVVWKRSSELKTAKDREVLKEWAAKGIKGVKVDFFDSEDADTMMLYQAVYEACAESHLVINCHGASKPTGEHKTYPAAINREGVNGEEQGGFWVDQATYLAYTRNVLGSADITPRLYSTSRAGNTVVAQMACNTIIEAGMPCMAGAPEDYLKFKGKEFYQNLPSSWDDIHFIAGEVGEYVSLARRSGNTWYASTLSADAMKNVTMPLDFLDDGVAYTATIYTSKGKRDLNIKEMEVTSKDILKYNLVSKDGYIAVFTRNEEAQPAVTTQVATTSAPVTESPVTSSPQTASTESLASVTSSRKTESEKGCSCASVAAESVVVATAITALAAAEISKKKRK